MEKKRNKYVINQGWKFCKNDSLVKEYPTDWESIDLPHTWNNVDGQDGGNDYYRGCVQYVKKFLGSDIEKTDTDEVYLEFQGVAMSVSVYVNQTLVAEHKGGYSTFRANITEVLNEGENILSVLVSNEENDQVYPQRADFTFYGGIYRDVNILVVDRAHFDMDYYGGNGMKITPVVKENVADLTCEAWVKGGESVDFRISSPEGTLIEATALVKDGYAKTQIYMEDVHLWNGKKDPFLYSVTAKLKSDNCVRDQVDTRIGLRSFYNDPQKGFFLNGESYPLRGVSRHQDRWEVGNALSLDMHKEDLQLIMEMGANTIRLAHYQHAQEFYDLCDEKGIVLWAEIPYITNHMDGGYDNTISQMTELITQNYHHPSIVCWGLSNEITVGGEITDFMMKNHNDLNDLAHKMDETRFTTMAHAFMLDIDDPIVRLADVCSYNLYFGWYLGELSENERFFDEYHEKYPNAVIGFSEYGADANPAYHNSSPEKGDYSEEYQCVYHEHILNCIHNRSYLWATHVWNMFDFAADGRDEGGKNGQNQKGLVTFDRKLKKDAFYLYKATWNKTDKFVHICGRRYVDRAEDTTQIKVYSNLPSVTLYLDGQEVETKKGNVVFSFEVPISGSHEIEAKGEGCSDAISIKRVDKFNESYRLAGAAPVVNWFDKAEINPNCFSIKDTLGDLKKNPQAGAILGKMMEKMIASRGDVAQSASGNKTLQKMMDKMTLESLIKQAGDAVPVEMIQQLNAAFQQIPKE